VFEHSFDTSAFINGRRDLYPPAIFPTLWELIEDKISTGAIRSIDLVKAEISAREDDTHN
jgi:hypothetical protein